MMLKIGPITIGRDDRPWIVRQIRGRATRLHLHDFVPDRYVGRDLTHFHFEPRTLSLTRLTGRSGSTKRDWQSWAPALGTCVVGLVCGTLIAYVLDPSAGRRRRAIARDRATGALHRTGRRLTRFSRAAGAYSRGWIGRATHPRFAMPPPVDDVVLVDRIKAVLFREHDFPKGRISIDAANGSVALRGEVERYEQIDQIESIVWSVSGVTDIENLLHMPGTPAPNTITAIEASH